MSPFAMPLPNTKEAAKVEPLSQEYRRIIRGWCMEFFDGNEDAESEHKRCRKGGLDHKSARKDAEPAYNDFVPTMKLDIKTKRAK